MEKMVLRSKFLFLVIFSFIVLWSCNSENSENRLRSSRTAAPARQWFQGGNLHNSTIGDWKKATYENKLATSADWLAVTKWKGHLNTTTDFNKIKPKAEMLVAAVNQVVAEKSIDNLNVTEIAVGIITLSNDLGP